MNKTQWVSAIGVVTNNQDRRIIEIRHHVKPAKSVRAGLKAQGWQWSRHGGCWWHHQDGGRALAHARQMIGVPDAGPDETAGPDCTDIAYEDACAAACGL